MPISLTRERKHKPDQRFISEKDWEFIRKLEDGARVPGKLKLELLGPDISNMLRALMRENKMFRDAVDSAHEAGFTEGYEACMVDHNIGSSDDPPF